MTFEWAPVALVVSMRYRVQLSNVPLHELHLCMWLIVDWSWLECANNLTLKVKERWRMLEVAAYWRRMIAADTAYSFLVALVHKGSSLDLIPSKAWHLRYTGEVVHVSGKLGCVPFDEWGIGYTDALLRCCAAGWQLHQNIISQARRMLLVIFRWNKHVHFSQCVPEITIIDLLEWSWSQNDITDD